MFFRCIMGTEMKDSLKIKSQPSRYIATYGAQPKPNIIMNNQTQTTSDDVQQLADDARALMAATADVAGEKVCEARKRLAAALEPASKSPAASVTKRSKARKPPTRPCMNIPMRPLASPLASVQSSASLAARRCDEIQYVTERGTGIRIHRG